MRELLTSLADTMASADPVRAKAAKLQMEQSVHRVCGPKEDKRERAAVTGELVQVIQSKRPRLVRAHAIKLLGFIGGSGEERLLGAFVGDRELGQDAKMARERIRRR